MEKPKRIQRKRTKGFRLPENCVSVTRPGKWGNPFTVEEEMEDFQRQYQHFGKISLAHLEMKGRERAVQKFRDMMNDLNSHEVMPEVRERFRWMRDHIRDLQGKDLACYCDLNGPCHADVLLEMSNIPSL